MTLDITSWDAVNKEIVMVEQIKEIISDLEKKIVFLDENGCSPLSKKYLHYTSELFRTKALLANINK